MADNDPSSHNYELWAMGLRGDDEDDLAADAEELFGSNAAINLDADVQGLPHRPSAQSTSSESVSTGVASGNGGSRKRRSYTSKPCKDFEEIYG
jgi:hypothetical protein